MPVFRAVITDDHITDVLPLAFLPIAFNILGRHILKPQNLGAIR